MPIISAGYRILITFHSRVIYQLDMKNDRSTSVKILKKNFLLFSSCKEKEAKFEKRRRHYFIEFFLDILAYYQWIPFILLLMSVLFYIPSILWHALSTKTGFDIANLVKTLHNMEQLNPDIRERTLRYIARHIDRALEIQREIGTGFFSQFKRILRRHCPLFIIGRAQGNYLTFIYLIVKLLYITNVIGQLFLLNVSRIRLSFCCKMTRMKLFSSFSWVQIITVMESKSSRIYFPVENVVVQHDFLE